MKNRFIFSLAFVMLSFIYGCKKEIYPGNYPGAVNSPYISIFDIRDLYQGTDVTLSPENMSGAKNITGVVISDHSGGNVPAGLLIMQDKRRLSQLRGIAIPLGSDAATYLPGDSLTIDVTGAVLKNVDGILQLTGISNSKVTKISSGNAIEIPIVKSNSVLAAPDAFESTLISITRVGFDATYPTGSTYAGDRIINDGFGNMLLHTEAGATFANNPIPFLANFTGIVFHGGQTPQLWPRTIADITVLSATAPKIAPIVITGYLVDPTGTDADYEYVQLLATKDINFATTNFSLVTTNNAGANTPTGFPVNGWATGGQRTYKINMTTGTVQKGQYFYVGGNKRIWGAGSTDISSSIWFSKLYASAAGDGFGSATTNLLANSGNAAGIAVFDLTNVTTDTIPVDVIFFGGAGNVYTPGPPARGYRITNTDYYDITNPSTLELQPFFNQGSNTGKLGFPAATNFSRLGGTYNITTGRWTTARTLTGIPLTTTSTVAAIEGATTLEQ
ncbi:MAG: hypothetical protein H7Y42_14215 [Chitinophagaceae bacterium]|nr:hypothetical protein [Chitinophagaceae bacterium]